MNNELCKKVIESLTNNYGKERANEIFKRLVFEIAVATIELAEENPEISPIKIIKMNNLVDSTEITT